MLLTLRYEIVFKSSRPEFVTYLRGIFFPVLASAHSSSRRQPSLQDPYVPAKIARL